ncbi:NAD-dependent epimerase/dehydratase family protein [Stenotrophomonas sp. MA5]|jgi:uncharacterized protein YbjT (DUF2867 family)|nr:NAD-dependent epimerase/dehydratase family protein [Stenotrophomonas sp. MA5]
MDSHAAPGRMKLLVAGATGLVGQGVVLACLESPRVQRVTALVRRPGSRPGQQVAELLLADFRQAAGSVDLFSGFDACLYCAGAPPVGTREAEYRAVTFDATLAVASAFAQACPQGRFLYVSGAHADPQSRIMPLRVKGQAEQALARLPIRTVMLRPGGVQPVAGTGTVHSWMKPLYGVGAPVLGLIARMAPSIATSNLALGRAMVALADMPQPPGVVECAQINRLGDADGP